MKQRLKNGKQSLITVMITTVLCFAGYANADRASHLIDNFCDATLTKFGQPRQFLNDTVAGGTTHAVQQVKNCKFKASGDITPPRGQPGWASSVLPLASYGEALDVSEFAGIRLLIKVLKGNISLSANSTEVSNFDYHAAPVVVKTDGRFHEVKVPFAQMKRAWSEQTPLNTATINSLSVVAYDLQPDKFEFELDEVSFY
ncbi:CIA30 family protein [Planctobacterium marinum]|uniref:NADH:ubiquinone oxidoreductase intermediate-associated protein 30 domain-containing protein n=1 Tax=Planctobacterium marinum TaxID=1631968 RepID=A0AA48KQ81_9ALTE|nr:hypothetical protein MACH26_03230 [Planctobacterium marinum]